MLILFFRLIISAFSFSLLLEVIHALSVREKTMVVVSSDNGGVINERGYVPGGWDESVTENWPLGGEKGSLYEGGIRVPLIVRGPGRAQPGSESNERVARYDFLPTFCDISGVAMEGNDWGGLSLAPVLDQSGLLQRDALYWHYPRYHRSTPSSAVISGRFRWIHFYEERRDELYDLVSDQGERFNIAESEPAKAMEPRKKLRAWLESKETAIPEPNPNYDQSRELIWCSRDRDTWHKKFGLPE